MTLNSAQEIIEIVLASTLTYFLRFFNEGLPILTASQLIALP